jgi:hypothetical protein
VADAQAVIDRCLSQWPSDSSDARRIPEDITKEDVEAAARAITEHGAGAQFGRSRRWDVVVGGSLFAPKRVIGVAARRLLGQELMPSDFYGGEESKCNRMLEALGFSVILKGDAGALVELNDDEEERKLRERKDLKPTTREQLIKARRGQGIFRTRVADVETNGCRITGVVDVNHLRASHIKPWCRCDDLERLDGHNGLLLSPHVDHLFDRGYISFEDDGKVVVSERLSAEVPQAWRLKWPSSVGGFTDRQIAYLSWHRANVFRK